MSYSVISSRTRESPNAKRPTRVSTAPVAKPEHFTTSQKFGELALLPTVRAAAADTLIGAVRFSCREQIEQGTGHGTLHLARTVRN